jgi:hypothetical protein
MKKETHAGEYTSRRKALGTVGKFIIPTIITFSLGDLAVRASDTINNRTLKIKDDNPGWGDHDGGGRDKTGSKR